MNSIKPGQCVRIPFGLGTASGTVVEDRGPIGVGGRRLFVVAVPNDPDEPDMLLRAEDELELEMDRPAAPPLSLEEIEQFLKKGGLVSILARNMSGGKNQPSVWLCRDSLGNVTYTFDEARGLAGGLRVPFFAIQGERIFRLKEDQVVDYIMSFGLSKQRAQAVVRKIGLAP